MRRYTFSEGTSHKFWQIDQQGPDLHIAWGRVGTGGQSQVKHFDSEADAAAAAARLVKEKTGKGYVAESAGMAEAGAQTPQARAVAESASAAPTAAPPAVARALAPAPATALAREPAVPTTAAKPLPAPSEPNWPDAPSVDDIALAGLRAVLPHIAQGEAKDHRWLGEEDLRALAGGALWQGQPQALPLAAAWVLHSALCMDGFSNPRSTPDVAESARWLAARLDEDAGASLPPSLARQWQQVRQASAAARATGQPGAWLGNEQPLAIPPALCRHWRADVRLDPSAAWAVVQGARELVARVTLAVPIDIAAVAQWLDAPAPALATPEVEAALLAMLMHDADNAAPDGKADRRVLALADLLFQLRSWPELVQIADQACRYDLFDGVRWGLELRNKLRRGLHGAFAARLHLWLAASGDADTHHAQTLAHIAQAPVNEARRVVKLGLLPWQADATPLFNAWLAAERFPDAVTLQPWVPAWPELVRTGRWAGASDVLDVWDDPLWLSGWLQGVAAAPDVSERLAQLGLVQRPVVRSLLAGVPHLRAFQALVDAGADSAPLGLAVARWPLLAVVGLTRALATARTPAPALQRRFDHMLPRLAPVLAQLPEVLAPWLGPAERAWLAERCQRLQGPAEVAGAADLPAVLAAPPWWAPASAAAPAKVAPSLKLQPLAMQGRLDWPDAARAQVLADSHHALGQPGDVPMDQQIDGLGFDHMASQQGSRERAARALQAGDAAELIEAWRYAVSASSGYVRLVATELSHLPLPLQLPFWNAAAGEVTTYSVDPWMAHIGVAGAPGLAQLIRRTPGEYWDLGLRMGDVALATAAARAAFRLQRGRREGHAWLLKWPEHAAAGLMALALAKSGEDKDTAARALRLLAANGRRPLLLEVAARHDAELGGGHKVADALQALLDLDPHRQYPSKIAPLPEFWQPRAWRRPVLHSGKALGEEALAALGQMLSFPRTEGLYVGIGEVQAACTPASLAGFAWDLFQSWLAAGAPAKENWALTALGLLGGDEAARRLTPLIRAWPGESAHARAVLGLDVLEQIGTDTALMQLNGIAQKLKFKGLQDKAREKIDAIAAARGLTAEELEDRLAPDLGLDARGGLLLDFGPRQFRVGFDEALKPWVREADGPRLKDLPKPNKADDADKAKAAVERYKALKADAKTIAAQQLQRLETAMCQRRRWRLADFRAFIAQHPLVRHIARRLIWGVYEVQDGANHGGTLTACFRLAEDDSSFTNASDEAFEVPDGDNTRIGVPHALELPAADAAAFGQVFADYELLQPFAQIGRDTYTLTEAEKKTDKLERWKGAKVPTGRVLGLANKGWRRGQAQDGGGIWYFLKPLGAQKVIELYLDPGIIVGMVDEYPEQELGEVKMGPPGAWGEIQSPEPFSALDAISASELIRDLEALRE